VQLCVQLYAVATAQQREYCKQLQYYQAANSCGCRTASNSCSSASDSSSSSTTVIAVIAPLQLLLTQLLTAAAAQQPLYKLLDKSR
jgi:hypothetical protein